MNTNRIITSLDIGTTAIKAFIAKKNEEGKIKIIGFGTTESIGVEAGVVTNPGQAAESIKIALEQAECEADVKVEEVYVGVAGFHLQDRKVACSTIRDKHDVFITKEEVLELRKKQLSINRPEGMDIIDIMEQKYRVDDQECEPKDVIGMEGSSLVGEYNIVLGSTSCLRRIENSVRAAGYKLKGLILQSIASAEAVLSAEDKSVGVCLVDIGGGTTDIAIFNKGVVRYIKSFPSAGNHITLDIERAYNLTPKNAEDIKIKYGTCLPEALKQQDLVVTIPGYKGSKAKEIPLKHLAGVVKSRVEEILDFILVELHNTNFLHNLQVIIMTGGGSQTRNIKQLSEYHIPDLATNIAPINEEYFDNLPDNLKQPIYATGLGLVIAAFKEEDEEMEQQDELLKEMEQQDSSDNKENNSDNNDTESETTTFLQRIKDWLTFKPFSDN
ncbi:MAG: cell division protein FtsA [Bacteroidales bacterium]|jgi:cell division protein FtsA|nr:cell division protein FtsA [Bacteroidales bacterium]